MRKKLFLLMLGLAALAAGLAPSHKAEAACKQICCPGDPPACVTCCHSPCPTIVCPP